MDGSAISEISKFNYLLEILKGKPKEDILGLPHTEDGEDGYGEAKRKRKTEDFKHRPWIKEKAKLLFGNNGGLQSL